MWTPRTQQNLGVLLNPDTDKRGNDATLESRSISFMRLCIVKIRPGSDCSGDHRSSDTNVQRTTAPLASVCVSHKWQRIVSDR